MGSPIIEAARRSVGITKKVVPIDTPIETVTVVEKKEVVPSVPSVISVTFIPDNMDIGFGVTPSGANPYAVVTRGDSYRRFFIEEFHGYNIYSELGDREHPDRYAVYTESGLGHCGYFSTHALAREHIERLDRRPIPNPLENSLVNQFEGWDNVRKQYKKLRTENRRKMKEKYSLKNILKKKYCEFKDIWQKYKIS